MKNVFVNMELLKSVKTSMEDLMEGDDDYRHGRRHKEIVAQGDAPKAYIDLCELINNPTYIEM